MVNGSFPFWDHKISIWKEKYKNQTYKPHIVTIGKLRFLSVLWSLYPKCTLIIHIFPFRLKFCDIEIENCHKPCLPWAIPFFTRPSLSYAQPLQNFLLKFFVHFEQHGHFNFFPYAQSKAEVHLVTSIAGKSAKFIKKY